MSKTNGPLGPTAAIQRLYEVVKILSMGWQETLTHRFRGTPAERAHAGLFLEEKLQEAQQVAAMYVDIHQVSGEEVAS